MSSITARPERRRKARKAPPNLIYVELGAGNGGMMRDLSPEGFALRAMMPVRVGDKTPFSFSLAESAHIAGQGDVQWVEENGRVACIRFAELPDQARSQIEDWLSGKLAPPVVQEKAEQPAPAEARTFDELREELRTTPVRPDSPERVPVEAAAPAPESAHVQAETAPQPAEVKSPPTPEARPLHQVASPEAALLQAELTLKKPGEAEQPLKPEVPHKLPDSPKSTTPQPPMEVRLESPPASARSFPEKRNYSQPAAGTSLRSILSEAQKTPPASPGLPDISEILIQPPHQERIYSSRNAVLESLDTLNQNRGRHVAPWTEWFTLSRVVAIMTGLALFVALTAYHQALGQALIWVGVRMGGEVTTDSSTPVSTPGREPQSDTATSVNAPSTKVAPNESAPTGATETNAEESTSAVRRSGNSPTVPPPKNSPPVTPLFGATQPPSTESGQEAGLSEYSQAMRLLHAKNRKGDTSEAVRLLWDSVEKGNPSAELTLAELYWHGEGVSRNCDQTRILLSAAARKGNPEAQKRLQQFQREGCE